MQYKISVCTFGLRWVSSRPQINVAASVFFYFLQDRDLRGLHILRSFQRRLEQHVPRRSQLDVEMLNFRNPWSRVRVWCWRPNDGRTDCSFYLQKEKENEIRHFYCQGLGQWTVPDNNYRVFFLITLSPEFPLGTCASLLFCFEGLQNEIGAPDFLQTATSDKRSDSRPNPLP